MAENAGGFYMQYLESLCRRRGWHDPSYDCRRDHAGFSCLVTVNERKYQTDLAYESDVLAQENAAMRAFMVCRNFSVNGGMLARNGIVQGLPADPLHHPHHFVASSASHRHRKPRLTPALSFSSISSSSTPSTASSASDLSYCPAAIRRHGHGQSYGHSNGHVYGYGHGLSTSSSSFSIRPTPVLQLGYEHLYSFDHSHGQSFDTGNYQPQDNIHRGQYGDDSSISSTASFEE